MIYQVLSTLLVIAVMILIFTVAKKKKPTVIARNSHYDSQFFQTKWLEIDQLMLSGKPSAYKTAVIEADKLLDYYLKSRYGSGGTMGERLKKARSLFHSHEVYDASWKAHKARNIVVHEVESEFFLAQAKKALEQFEQVFKTLRLL